jgi:Amidase
LWRWEAIEIARAVRTRQISSREAVLACLERIEQVNPRVNAVIELRPEEALAAADAADAAIARGETIDALHGVPVTIKVNVDQQGCATTNSVVAFRDKIATGGGPAAVVGGRSFGGRMTKIVHRSRIGASAGRCSSEQPIRQPSHIAGSRTIDLHRRTLPSSFWPSSSPSSDRFRRQSLISL